MDRVTFTINGVKQSDNDDNESSANEQATFHIHIRGNVITVGGEVSSNTTLLDYIRKVLDLRGTKYMCKEAGCGACIVAFSKGHGCRPQGVNSCMVSVTSCQDWDVTTIEKVGNRLKGYHPLQVALAEGNGSQCGYCSPGWVMAMYGLLKTKPRTMLEIEKDLGSNVCRCTGYRPILEAFKKFGTDAPKLDIPDIEDLRVCTRNEACDKTQCDKDWCVVSKEDVPNKIIHIELHDHRHFYRVEMLDDIFNIFRKEGVDSYMLVGGNTGRGVVPILEYPRLLIDISSVWELKGHYVDQNVVVGAGSTLTELMEIFDALSRDDYFSYFRILNEHLEQVAHIPVKNIGTIAGNLMVKHGSPEFQSDIFLLLSTVGAQLTILHGPGLSEIVPMYQFLRLDMTGKVILNVMFPPLNSQYKVRSYKIMPRSQNAHAFVNGGFLYKLKEKTHEVLMCRIVYGGISPEFSRAAKTESYLIGRRLFTNETLEGALEVLDRELEQVIVPLPPNPSVQYRKQLALGLFYKGLLALCPRTILSSYYDSGAIKLHETRPLSRAQQEFDTNPAEYPLNEPIPKIEALYQCAGEAKYSEDIPTLTGEVYACFVLTTIPLGKILKIDPSEALKRPGVIAFYTAADIPGVNSFTPVEAKYLTTNEELLCNGDVKYFNQPLGIIVAETERLAEIAAKLVHVTYKEDTRKPVIDVKDAKKDPARVKLFATLEPTRVGPDVQRIVKGEKTIYGQYHFTMETLVCVSFPTEEGLRVYSSTQYIDVVQQMTSRALKIETNRVDVVVRRLGGAYGIKISRPTQSAVACNLVVHKLNRPCRFIQPLRVNTRAVGKRLPCSVDFQAGVNERGEIQFINYNLFSDNGYIVNELFAPYLIDAYYNCYDRGPWRYTGYNVVTDTASNTWCRSPGTLESVTTTELIMEQIAYELGLDPVEVRLANLDRVQHNAIQEMTDTLRERGEYAKRREYVNKFNKENRWKKRGLRFTFLKWTPTGTQYMEVNMAVYHEDGTVAISHSGVEMGQGINTKAAQIAAYLFKIPVSKIQIKASDTVITPNCFTTGGSITSQNIGIGVTKCCEELLTRLAPLRASLNYPTWEVLIKAAWDLDMDLQVHGFVNGADIQMYQVYGVTLSEVEIDVLTGEHEIIRVDLIEDVGRSVNPDIDVGQVEGAFIMGVGYWTCEELVYVPQTGELLSDRTWEYHVPQARDIPQDFRLYFRKGSYSTPAAYGAKATGEPATCMGVGIAIALREAITAARTDSGIPSTQWYEIDGPHTVEKICLYSATKKEQFRYY